MKESYDHQLIKAEDFILNNDNFLIVSHVHPDGDTISSSLAMANILKFFKKEFIIVNQDFIPNKFSYLPMFDLIQNTVDIKTKYSVVITVDVADFTRSGNIEQLLADNYRLLNIDHHPTNDYFGDFNLVLPEAAATAEIIFDLAAKMEVPFDEHLATCIYTGLLTDTGGFRYSNTTSKVMSIAAKMLDFKVNPGKIAEYTLETLTHDFLLLLKKTLDNLEVIENGKITLSVLENQDLRKTASNTDTEGLVNYTRNIEGVEVGILLKEIRKNEIKVSLRSKDYIDVGAIAKSFKGGGHSRAAGFTYIGNLKELKSELLAKIKESQGWNNIES